MGDALIVVDTQSDYFPDGKLTTWQPVETAEVCTQLIKKFRQEGKEAVYLQHIIPDPKTPLFTEGSHGAQINDIVKPLPTKSGEYLVSKGVKKLIVLGMMIYNCVNSTVYSGVDEGFHCIIADEAVNTMDQKLDDKIIETEQIKESFLAGGQFVYSKVYMLQDVLDDSFTYEKY